MSTALLTVKAAVLTPRTRYLLKHTFSGDSLTPSDLGPNLTDSGGNAIVGSGVLSKGSAGNLGLIAASIAPHLTYQLRMNFGDSAATDRRVMLRLRSNLAGDLIEIGIHRVVGGVTGIQINSRASGSPTQIALRLLTIVDNAWYVARVEAYGSRLQIGFGPYGQPSSEHIVASSSLYLTQSGIEVAAVDANSTITIDDLAVWSKP